jgi:cytochrome b561
MRQFWERLIVPSNLAVEPTRVAAGDDRLRYDGVEIALHWGTALLVAALWLIAQAWGFLPRGSAPRHALQSVHVSVGLLFAAVLAARILWRLGPGRRPLPATTGAVELASKAVHFVLYALLLAQTALGVLWRWGTGDPLSLFGLFAIPSPAAFSKADARLFGDLHGTIANVIMVLAGLHAAAALFHHYVLRDDVLWRMLPRRWARRAARKVPDPHSLG